MLHVDEIGNPDGADPGRSQIEDDGRAKPARPDNQHARGLQFLLPRPANLVQDQMPLIALYFFRAETHALFLRA